MDENEKRRKEDQVRKIFYFLLQATEHEVPKSWARLVCLSRLWPNPSLC